MNLYQTTQRPAGAWKDAASSWEANWGIQTVDSGGIPDASPVADHFVRTWRNFTTGSLATQTDLARMPIYRIDAATGRPYVDFYPGRYMDCHPTRTFDGLRRMTMAVALHSSTDTVWKYRNENILLFNPGWQGVPKLNMTGSTGNGLQITCGGDSVTGGKNAAIVDPDLIGTSPVVYVATWQTASTTLAEGLTSMRIWKNGLLTVSTDAAQSGITTTATINTIRLGQTGNTIAFRVAGFWLTETFADDAEAAAITQHAAQFIPPVVRSRTAAQPPILNAPWLDTQNRPHI